MYPLAEYIERDGAAIPRFARASHRRWIDKNL